MHEGIATNIANQIKTNKIINENIDLFFKYGLFKNSNYNEFISHQGYTISYKIIKFLLDNYKKQTVMDLMKIKYDFKNSCEEELCKILGMQKDELVSLFKSILEK